ncbi:hypothetical protein [Parabacteroides sp. Marseille-P3160]|uniref:helix-turn-helix transcriptional regulator n=1 Tax=Parabacteroides sp. Marseille-P3160 TaxID=1917887 RepID=UPI0009BB3951|nr:hypothetical protein [Parabacteroides sp. Marseille-P3160]
MFDRKLLCLALLFLFLSFSCNREPQETDDLPDHLLAFACHRDYTHYLASVLAENSLKAVLEIREKNDPKWLQSENIRLVFQRKRLLFYSFFLLSVTLLLALVYYKKCIQSKKKEREAEQKINRLMEMAKSFDEKERSFHNTLLHHFGILKKAALLEKQIKKEKEKRNGDQNITKLFNEIAYGREELDWNILYHSMNELQYHLFDRLREVYPALDETEFCICCLTYMKFHSDEIGIIMELSLNTVQMKRSSIRKKLGIPPMGNISDFLYQKFNSRGTKSEDSI